MRLVALIRVIGGPNPTAYLSPVREEAEKPDGPQG